MRYAKCENCKTNIIGKQKYLMVKVTETKGKHRNSKKETMLRLCTSCGKKLYKYRKERNDLEYMADLSKPSQFTKDYKEYMAQLNHSILKISFPIARIINFFQDKKTSKIINNLNNKELVSLDESLGYMKGKILDYANSLEYIRDKLKTYLKII
jgi:hypothetical protein